MTFIDELEAAIARGETGAALIEWAPANDLFGVAENSPSGSIAHAMEQLKDAGWVWYGDRQQIERDGWYVWFRSQGPNAPPVAQWNRLKFLQSLAQGLRLEPAAGKERGY